MSCALWGVLCALWCPVRPGVSLCALWCPVRPAVSCAPWGAPCALGCPVRSGVPPCALGCPLPALGVPLARSGGAPCPLWGCPVCSSVFSVRPCSALRASVSLAAHHAPQYRARISPARQRPSVPHRGGPLPRPAARQRKSPAAPKGAAGPCSFRCQAMRLR